MVLEFINDQEEDLGFDWKELITKVVFHVLKEENCPYEVEISITLTDNCEIRRMNREFRNIDTDTDVLSFPMIEFSVPGKFKFLEQRKEEFFNLETENLIMGDIVISLEKAKEQALFYGHSLKREIGFLTAHSVLHLCGYDHVEEEERSRMEQKQSDILTAMGILRE